MLEQYFSDDRIISQICKERVKQAGQRHDRQYINRLEGNMRESAPVHPFYQMLPPRRLWSAFRPRFRTDGLNSDLYALKKAVRILRHQHPNQVWVVELNRYITAIRERVFNCHMFAFESPTISWELKGKGGQDYRALCRFNPDDNLILCLYANYLRDVFDPLFSNSSFAFRAAQNGHIPTHHDAFSEIYNLRQKSGNRSFYVAECDIRGFFDTVDHSLALSAFREAAANVNLHPRAEVLFRAYLNCYNFPLNVLAEAEPRLKQRNPDGYFKWHETELRALYNDDPRSLRIGVAQGGAVSGIIANLIMDAADKCVEAERAKLGAEIHYFRYCDDMVLMSPNRKHCENVFDAYKNKLSELKLAFHNPENTCIYGKDHWNNKSKAPYLWSGLHWFRCVPWVQFVGYQIRYDGLVRPRKEAVEKQCMKLIETTNMMKFGLLQASQRNQIKANKNQALASLKSKLVAQGVGRVKGFTNGPKPMCWAWGYKALHNKPIVDQALRVFDKTRRKQLRRFAAAVIRYGNGCASQNNVRPNPEGYAFSYLGQFTNLGGRNFIQNPWKPRNLIDRAKQFAFLFLTRRLLKWFL